MKHTPGPWEIQAVSDCVRIVTRVEKSLPSSPLRSNRKKVILARLNPPQLAEAETHANALLMATAPELLDALKACLHAAAVNYDASEDNANNPTMQMIGEAMDAGNKAIAKTEGRL